MPILTEISHFLDHYLESSQYFQDPNGIIVNTGKPILRMGIALEPWPEIASWIERMQLDALFLHRPWQLDLQILPDNLGLLAYHLSFDEKLTIGYNRILAKQLGITELENFGYKEERSIGMIGKIPEITFQLFLQKTTNIFHGLEQVYPGKNIAINKITVVGAMTESLIQQAVESGAQVYITGQFRKTASKAVVETGIHVIEIGHYRSEIYALKLLAQLLRDQWPTLQVCVKVFN